MNNAKLSILGQVVNSVTLSQETSVTLAVNFILIFPGSLLTDIPFELALKINVRKLNLHLNFAALLIHESSLIQFNVNGFVNKRQNYFQQIK